MNPITGMACCCACAASGHAAAAPPSSVINSRRPMKKVVEHRDRLDDPFDGLWAEGCHAHSQEADIALQPHRLVKPHSLEFIFGMVLAMAVTILAITTWAAPPNPESDSAMLLFPREMF